MRKKDLLIFDMDGTLIDSGNVISNTINYVRANFDLEPLEKSYLLENLNNPHINSAEFFYGTPTFTQEQTKLFEEYYHEHCISDLILYDGVLELLVTTQKDFILTIATNANSIFAKKMLKHLEINSFFNYIVGADMVENSKPQPDMIHKVIKELNHSNQSTLIGDSHKDFLAAQNANINSILVNWGFSYHGENGVNTTQDLIKKIYNV
ncbi:HAD family hydrolase [Arcobacter sp. FWKO B]|uniref:HAD family hydrolase n=1 Tax=Arcobacter sp. FWKO B TaxID=2593672 RepID=UPI0018A644D4|nr:HAD family hydrolase [Arcobacter sp. FWKO B]QOG13179.1 HAD family hydrolase [Arcobacter sp. FWKO B]